MTPELAQRIVTGVILIIVAGLELWLGGNALWVLATIIGLVMMHEWIGLIGQADQRRSAQYALCIPLALLSPLAAGPGLVAALAFGGVALFLLLKTRSLWLAGGALYVALPVLALLWLRAQDNGLLLAFWGLSLVWATDIGAFFAGRSFGGPKVAPRISPNKTWSGLFGGMLAALLLGWAFTTYFGLPFELALISPLLAILAQMGDFFESWMKRRAGVKDSGTLIPGHGGVLDRLDGVVTSLPVAALLVWFGF